MAGSRVRVTGCSVHRETGGYYAITSWYLLEDGGRMQEVLYQALTWTEACDVVMAELDGHRPGWPVGDGWSQPPLFED